MDTQTILVVDDDEDVRSSVADALVDLGYRTETAGDGRQALEFLSAAPSPPNLILLDMMMPEMDGWTFMSELHKVPDLASIPVVIFSAYGNPREVAGQLGAAGYLRKPLRLEELAQAVERCATSSSGA